MRYARFLNIALLLGAFALAGCDSESSPVGPEPDPDPDPTLATVAGQVESTHETASSPAMSSGPAAVAGEASTVAVAAVESDGALEVLAEAEVQSDGRFSIEDVPTGRSGLVVSARAAGGEEVGRALVHGETEAGATVTTAPINGETTVEGLVYARLQSAGVAEQIRNTAQLALLIRMDESTASDVAASAQSIQVVADAYVNGAGALEQGLAAMGEANAQARAQAMLVAALEHAERRDGGQSAEAAQEAFLEAALGAFVQGGAELEAVALATAAAATGLDRAMEVADANARLDMAKNAVELNLLARSEFAAGTPESGARASALTALANARANVRAAATLDGVIEALASLEAEAEETLLAAIMDRLPEQVPEPVRAQLRVRLETAFASADLSAELNGQTDAESIVTAVMEYRQQVRSAVEAFIAELPAGVDITAEAVAGLLIAVRGGPDLSDDA